MDTISKQNYAVFNLNRIMMNDIMLRKIVAAVRRRVVEEVPERGDFKAVEERFENRDVCLRLTHISLSVEAVPKGFEDDDEKRFLDLRGYDFPCHYMSSRSVLYGNKQDILAKLDDENLIDELLEKLPKLAEDLSDL